MKKIFYIEDDADIAKSVKSYLENKEFLVSVFDDISSAQIAIKDSLPALCLIDINLSGENGKELCRWIRKNYPELPVIFITVQNETKDIISGFNIGADDYITKPFSPNVLVARIKANLAQYDRLKNTEKQEKAQIQMGNILLQQDSRRVFVDGTEVELKNKEYELLLFLMSNADIVFSKETLYERIWGYEAMGDNATVAVHINRLREKIEKNPSQPRYIQTVWGAGYRFRP